MNISEKLFIKYRSLRSLPVKHIDTQVSIGRFPDFEVSTPHGIVICEVKQFDANEQDIQFVRKLKKYDHASDHRTPGKRVHSALKDAAGQLRRYKRRGYPCIVILFDNTIVDGNRPFSYGNFLTPRDIDAGMFGNISCYLT